MHNLYNVPIIHQDLSTDATILHIANALDYLTNTVNDIFMKIDNRIEENCKRTARIAERIDKANEKINKLVGSNKATIVYSSAKYPAGNVHKDPETTFKRDDRLKFKIDESIISKPLDYDEKMLGEKLHFFHVKSNDFERSTYKITPEEGLGCIPNDINSVTSMLLYNTKENPYKRYISLDPLNPAMKHDNEKHPQQNTHNMEDAPISISNRMGTVKKNIDGYFYSPNLGEVPQIDVPLDLPDLPGIADDISFSLETGPTIAPSIATTPALFDLPELSEMTTSSPVLTPTQSAPVPVLNLPDVVSGEDHNVKKDVKISNSNEVVKINQKQMEEVKVVLPPPPPPVLPPQDIVVEKIAPPPPPLMPPPMPPLLDMTPTPVSKSTAPRPGAPIHDRANLMEAIRLAGGAGKAKLRAAKPVQKESDKSKSAPASGNLMADLHAKLSMRRKGISGNKPEQSNEGGVMDKISAMIPPPPKPEPKTESDDTDWE